MLLLKLYLLSYNLLQCLGWSEISPLSLSSASIPQACHCYSPPLPLHRSLALAGLLRRLLITNSIHGAYAASGDLICFLQTAAILEVFHAVVGLVRSRVVVTLMQVAGKIHWLLFIVRQIAEVQEHPSVFITFITWSISEVIRYSHYCSTILGTSSSWLTYLRYTAFIVLYPIGIFPGEMWLMIEALPFIKERNLYSRFFDGLRVSYHSFVVALLMLYPFLWLSLFLHLFKQRRGKLGENVRKKL